MSAERFAWLGRWVADPDDIVRTKGSESNVKEIYDACARARATPRNVVLNQFREIPNHLVHRMVTGPRLERVYHHLRRHPPGLRLRRVRVGDRLGRHARRGRPPEGPLTARIVAVEALECPTMLYNGFGEHNIQGIGDKHIPFIHNVTNTDVVVGVSDRATDALFAVFNDRGAAAALDARGRRAEVIAALPHFGLSSICNVLAAIKTAKALGLGPDDALFTVATDGAALYPSELDRASPSASAALRRAAAPSRARHPPRRRHHRTREELTPIDRDRIFNLGYFTWVEQQGVPLAEFEARRRSGVLARATSRGSARSTPPWPPSMAAASRSRRTAPPAPRAGGRTRPATSPARTRRGTCSAWRCGSTSPSAPASPPPPTGLGRWPSPAAATPRSPPRWSRARSIAACRCSCRRPPTPSWSRA
jgi:cysteine synthase A